MTSTPTTDRQHPKLLTQAAIASLTVSKGQHAGREPPTKALQCHKGLPAAGPGSGSLQRQQSQIIAELDTSGRACWGRESADAYLGCSWATPPTSARRRMLSSPSTTSRTGSSHLTTGSWHRHLALLPSRDGDQSVANGRRDRTSRLQMARAQTNRRTNVSCHYPFRYRTRAHFGSTGRCGPG